MRNEFTSSLNKYLLIVICHFHFLYNKKIKLCPFRIFYFIGSSLWVILHTILIFAFTLRNSVHQSECWKYCEHVSKLE